MSVTEPRATILQQIAKLPIEAVLALVRLLTEALASDDPARVIERRAAATASHHAAQETVKKALEKK